MSLNLENVKCKYKAVKRPGLYIMVFLILLNTCDIPYHIRENVGPQFDKINKRIEKIEKKLDIEEAEDVRRLDKQEKE